jgi:predicted component of type VI protein secretion system
MKLNLVVLTPGKGEGMSIPITLGQFLIGRDPQCNLRPASPLISKRHCAVVVKGEQVFLHDFGSTNGTLLNDQPVKGEVELHNEDRLKVGPLSFLVRMEPGAVPVDKKTPMPPTKTPVPPTRAPASATKTPAPPTKVPGAKSSPPQPAVKAPTSAEEDESAAEMLLGLMDDGETVGGPDKVPDGSTVMDVPTLPGEVPPPGEAPSAGKDRHAQAKAQSANTSTAAKAILEKYMKRPRS